MMQKSERLTLSEKDFSKMEVLKKETSNVI